MVEMKSRLSTLVFVIAILCGLMIVPVAAQSNHTLEWGVDVGEEFIYVLQREYYSDPSGRVVMENQLPFLADIQPGERVILEVTSLWAIVNQINESSQLPLSFCSLKRYNDSALIDVDLTSFVLPVHDWNFLTKIHNVTTTSGLSLIDTDDEWGTIGVGTVIGGDGGTVDVRIETRYNKENGTLSYLRYQYSAWGTDIIDVVFVHWYQGVPTIIIGGIPLTTTLIIVTSGLISIIIAFLVYRAIRSRKSIIQKLGE
ncbi:MAG: hypothetical protein ACFFEE_05340 [Candidatus Thorarchaeota archaeon]